MSQQKPAKKAPARVVKPTRPVAARTTATASKAKQTKATKPATKTTVAASSRKPGVRVGSGSKKKSGNILASLFTGTRKWITLVVFVVAFGGLGTYFIKRSSAAVYNDYGCYTLPQLSQARGSNGPCVYKLQNVLKNRWGHALSVDGKFYNITTAQVKSFQKNQGITDDGVVGPTTWSRLNQGVSYATIKTVSTTSETSQIRNNTTTTTNVKAAYYDNYGCPDRPVLRSGDRNNCVRKLQNLLTKRWGYSLKADGVFGTGTKNAVIEFQKSKGFTGKDVDGVVGAKTWAKLADNVGVMFRTETTPAQPKSAASTSGGTAKNLIGDTGGTNGPATKSGSNGNLPSSSLAYVSFCLETHMSKKYLQKNAAASMIRMYNAYVKDKGRGFTLESCYRDIAGQKSAKAKYGSGAATVGTSNHGWGLAVDFKSSTVDYTWIKKNGPSYGWYFGNVSGEKWHYVYKG